MAKKKQYTKKLQISTKGKSKAISSFTPYPHFRRYYKSGHPALVLSEEDKDKYRFRRVTSSEKSGHHKNEKVVPNPDRSRSTPMYIVKREEVDKKIFFSKKKYPWKYKK